MCLIRNECRSNDGAEGIKYDFMIQKKKMVSDTLISMTTIGLDEPNHVTNSQAGDVLPDAGLMGGNYKTLLMWNRSVFQLVYKEVCIYYLLHVSLTLIYEFALAKEQQKSFDGMSEFFRSGNIDSNGLLVDAICMISGFLLTMSVSRYFNINFAMPGVQRVLVAYIYGLKSADEFDGKSQWIEKYSSLILLMWALTFRTLSYPFRRKYPTIASLQAIKIYGNPLMNDHERQILEDCERQDHQAAGIQVFMWSLTLLRQTYYQKGFLNSGDASKAIEALHVYKKACGNVMKFVSKNIPLSATQAVLAVVYAYGICHLLGRPFNSEQCIVRGLYGYFPFWATTIYFLFFTWLKVALVVANPFGKDDQDIDCVSVFQGHMQCIIDHVTYVNNEDEQIQFMKMSGCGKRIETVEDSRAPHWTAL